MIIRLDQIIIGDRCRKDLGDIDGLASSIAEVGLLHPPVVTPDLRLIAGERRIAALKSLGLVECEVSIADSLVVALALAHAERDENTCRKDLSLSEAAKQAKRLRPLEEAEAKGRQGTRTDLKPSAKLAGSRGETRDKVAAAVGKKRTTLAKAEEVVDAAKADPALAPLVEEMDRTGNVDRAHKKLKTQRRREASVKAAQDLASTGDGWQVLHGDFREIMPTLAADSVDLIFTDPPYDDESSVLYGDLAEQAARVLKPGGSLLAYVGHNTLGQVLTSMSLHLRYWWTIAMHHKGPAARLQGKNIFVEWKPLVWFVKERRGNDEYISDFIEYGMPTGFKEAHEWQQHEAPAALCIEKLTAPGETVVDPFMGSGTTLLAAARIGRRAIGIDCDQQSVEIAKGRLHELRTAAQTT